MLGVSIPGELSVLLLNVSVPVVDTRVASETAVLNSASVPDIVLSVRSIVLFVSVSVVALPTNVSVALGKVKVWSEVLAGPINFTALLPFVDVSLNDTKPGPVLPFCVTIPASW